MFILEGQQPVHFGHFLMIDYENSADLLSINYLFYPQKQFLTVN